VKCRLDERFGDYLDFAESGILMTQDDRTAALAPSQSTVREATRLEITKLDGSAEKWRLELSPDQLALYSPTEPQPFVFPRVDVAEKIQLVEGVRSLMLKTFPKKPIFRLERQDFKTLLDWLGPPTAEELSKALKKRFGPGLILGCVLLLISLPLVQNPAAGLAPFAYGLVNFALGGLMVTTWAIARFNPHRICFLLEAAWLGLVTFGPIMRIARGGSWWWLIFIAFMLLLAKVALGQYRRFAGTGKQAAASQARNLVGECRR